MKKVLLTLAMFVSHNIIRHKLKGEVWTPQLQRAIGYDARESVHAGGITIWRKSRLGINSVDCHASRI